eukprot:gene25599-11251_t
MCNSCALLGHKLLLKAEHPKTGCPYKGQDAEEAKVNTMKSVSWPVGTKWDLKQYLRMISRDKAHQKEWNQLEMTDAAKQLLKMDVPLSYGLLRGGAMEYGRKEEARISKLDYSAGVIAFNWCFNKRLHSLLHHNVFLSSEFRRSWNRATCPDTLAFSPNFYVHCPVRTDSSAAPPGCDSIMVLLPVANMQQMIASGECKSGDKGIYKSLVEEGRKAVLRTMKEAGVGKGRDLADCIISEKVIEPEEWKEW